MKPNIILIVVILMFSGTVFCDFIPNDNTTKIFRLFTDLKANWYRANHYCISNEMRLASILSKNENDQVQKLITESGFVESFWIGGTNLGNEPHFYWMGNKSPMTFTDWKKNEPNNYGGIENCILIYIGSEDIKWIDDPCSKLKHFICEEIYI